MTCAQACRSSASLPQWFVVAIASDCHDDRGTTPALHVVMYSLHGLKRTSTPTSDVYMNVFTRQVRDEDIVDIHLAHPQKPLQLVEIAPPAHVVEAAASSPSARHAVELGFVGLMLHFLG